MSNDAIVLLKEDHKEVKELFRRFEQIKDGGGSEVGDVVRDACRLLIVHTKVEEELFYPAARDAIDDGDLLDEANEEHHVADVLIEELSALDPDDDAYVAKFTVLTESVKHHIEEEEDELFPKVRDQLGRNDLQDLGEKMLKRKQELLEDMRQATS